MTEPGATRPGWGALAGDRHRTTVVSVLVAAGLWAWWAVSRGWFLQADLSNLADGMNERLDWAYLSRPLGGHFAPVARILYWLLGQIAPLDYGVGVVFRVALHVLASWLLYRLLVAMVGRRWIVVAATALWAFNPVVLAGTAWLASGIGAGLGQCFALLALERWVRWLRTRDLTHAAVAGGWFALTILTFDTYAALAPVPLLLTVTVFTRGGPGTRIMRLIRDWPAVLAWLLPPAAAVALQLALGNATGASTLSAHRALHLVEDAWTRMIAPSLVGGPLRWYEPTPGAIPFALTADWLRIASQIAIAVVVVAGVARLGWRSLAGLGHAGRRLRGDLPVRRDRPWGRVRRPDLDHAAVRVPAHRAVRDRLRDRVLRPVRGAARPRRTATPARTTSRAPATTTGTVRIGPAIVCPPWCAARWARSW